MIQQSILFHIEKFSFLCSGEMNMVSSFKELKKRKAYTRIVKWKKITDNEPDKIKRFIFRWISFNGLY